MTPIHLNKIRKNFISCISLILFCGVETSMLKFTSWSLNFGLDLGEPRVGDKSMNGVYS